MSSVELAAVLLQRLGHAHPRVLVRPLYPALHAEAALERHEERVVGQPAAVGLDEGGDFRGVALPAAPGGEAQQLEAVLVYLPVVDVLGVGAPVDALRLARLQQPVGESMSRSMRYGLPALEEKDE